jgi:galactokinase
LDLYQKVIKAFHHRFGTDPEFMIRAPGRVNLLGEHVDYNDGFVLPAAVDRTTILAGRSSNSSQSTILALDMRDEVLFDLKSIQNKRTIGESLLPHWALYPAGLMWSLNAEKLDTPGLEAVFASDVPRGAGLSSSASVELAFGLAWEKLGDWTRSPLALAKLSQRAENQYVGVNCGIMDQFASACGVEDHLLYLDCRSLDWQTVPLPSQVSLVVANTNVRRSLATSAYNDRRAACEEAVRILKEYLPDIHSLRDVSPNDFYNHADHLPSDVKKRAQHIVEEIERTRHAVDILANNDIVQFGKLMNECHISLRDLYQVSCSELDVMAEIAWSLPGCYGARLTGGGFGGCTVNLVAQEATGKFSRELARLYKRRTGLKPEIYICRAANGAGFLEG